MIKLVPCATYTWCHGHTAHEIETDQIFLEGVIATATAGEPGVDLYVDYDGDRTTFSFSLDDWEGEREGLPDEFGQLRSIIDQLETSSLAFDGTPR